jgi:hypothetical protein
MVWITGSLHRSFGAGAAPVVVFGLKGNEFVASTTVDLALIRSAIGPNGPTTVFRLQSDINGSLLLVGPAATTLATSPTNTVDSTSFFTIEMAVCFSNTVWNGSETSGAIETRVNGLRIPSLTGPPLVFPSAGGQPGGTMTHTAIGSLVVANNPSLVSLRRGKLGYFWQGYDLTVSNPPWASANFAGDKKRLWLKPGVAGAHPIADWVNGVGTYPTSINDSALATPGADSDGSYIKNVTAPVAGAPENEKISHTISSLPAGIVSLAKVQRVIVAETVSGTAPQIRVGIRRTSAPVADTMGTTHSITGSNYKLYTQMYGATDPVMGAAWVISGGGDTEFPTNHQMVIEAIAL